jgi:hypothetical protein
MSILTSDYIAGWYLLEKISNNNFDVSQQPFYLMANVTNTSTTSIAPQELIQGDAGTLVIDQKGQKETSIFTGSALIIKNVDTTVYTFKDIIDLLIEDYELLLSFMFMSIEDINNTGDLDYLNNLLASFGLTIENKNLLSSATINIGSKIDCTLNYNTKYTRKFNVKYNNYSESLQPNYDFIARIAKNYDCRFYIDGNEYKIKSGTVNINIGYKELYIANTKSSLPFYSPQSHAVTGSLEIIAPHNSNTTIPVAGNCSVLIDNRYIELGQASVKQSYSRSLNPSQTSTINISFTAYARLGAGIDRERWLTYYLAKLDSNRGELNNTNALLNILKGILNI